MLHSKADFCPKNVFYSKLKLFVLSYYIQQLNMLVLPFDHSHLPFFRDYDNGNNSERETVDILLFD